jgi:CRP-like cAMP-binding protein
LKEHFDDTAIFEAFRAHLQSMTPVSDDLWLLLTSAMQIASSRKGEILLEEGAVCRHIYFIFKGSFRFLHLKENEEVTTGLFTEGICMTNMKSLTTLQPSTIFIQTLEDAIVVKMNKESLIALYKQAPGIEGIGRIILEHMLADDADWKEIYTIYSPEERYHFLLKKAPQIIQKIPLQYIASFLGMRRETLSRIRSRSAKSSL